MTCHGVWSASESLSIKIKHDLVEIICCILSYILEVRLGNFFSRASFTLREVGKNKSKF